jgi:type I restriction enzyme M protein
LRCEAQFFLSGDKEIGEELICVSCGQPFKYGTSGQDQTGFDFVVSRIPFGQRQEWCHLQNMLNAAAPSGTAIAVIPNGVLFRMSKDDTLRRKWIEENYLDTLIYLPENLLYATRIPVSIVVLKLRRLPESAVQFVDLSHGEDIGRKRSQLGEALLHIAKQSIQGREPMEQRCKLVSQEELIANDYILNRERYFLKIA